MAAWPDVSGLYDRLPIVNLTIDLRAIPKALSELNSHCRCLVHKGMAVD